MRPKTDNEVEAMREGGRILAQILNELVTQVAPGMTTKDLANFAAKQLKKYGASSAFLNYEGFPDVICISLNDEVVHGIPSAKRQIKDTDVVKLDFGLVHKGLTVDGATTVIAGQSSSAELKRLLEGTQRALSAGIDAIAGDGVKVGTVSAAIQKVLDQSQLGVIRDLVGHGVGDSVHEDPNIPNYGVPGAGAALKAGMTIAIEPMATLGDYHINMLDDGWTVVTRDGSLAAHFEHTVLITETGAEILTEL